MDLSLLLGDADGAAAAMDLSLLLGDADGAALTVGGLGALAAHAQAPVVPQTAVGADLLEPLEVLAQLHVESVGDALRELAVLGVLLAVEHPVRPLDLARVLHNRHQPLHLLRSQLPRTVII